MYDIEIVYTAQQEMTGDCDVTVTIDNDELTLNSDTITSEIQNMVDAVEAIQEVGGVMVERWEGPAEEGYLRVVVRLIFVTGQGITQDQFPVIAVFSNNGNCSLDYNITAGFVQQLTTPTFQVGFPDTLRRTRPLPVIETTPTQLQFEMETLLAYECSKNAPNSVSPSLFFRAPPLFYSPSPLISDTAVLSNSLPVSITQTFRYSIHKISCVRLESMCMTVFGITMCSLAGVCVYICRCYWM